MGVVRTIGRGRWPKQGEHLGKRVEVCYDYDTGDRVPGTVVRDDAEEPWQTIIRTDDGRYVRGSECQYTLAGTTTPDDLHPHADEEC